MINQEDFFKKIGVILNELNNQYEFLAQNPQQLNELELALFHANANFLSDHVQILIKISKNETPLAIGEQVVETESEPERDLVQEQQQVETITFADEVPEIDSLKEQLFKLDQTPSTFEFILNEHSEHERFDFEEKSADQLFNRPLSQEEENILAQKKKLNKLAIEEPIDGDEDEIGPEPFLVSKPVVEEFPIDEEDLDLEEATEPVVNVQKTAVEDPSYKPTVNELLAAKTDKSVNENNGANSISDLKQGINLNDKLIYIKDLFSGYNLAYAEAIDLANKLPNFEAADNFFKKNYAVKNNWAEKQATVDKFYALLNQRFK